MARLATLRPLVTSTLSGRSSPQAVAAPPDFSLSLDGHVSLGGYIFKEGVPFLHDDGGVAGGNTALGHDALSNLTIGVPVEFYGKYNTALGGEAMEYEETGFSNVAVGSGAMRFHTDGYFNTAVGVTAMVVPTSGDLNTAVGYAALGGPSLDPGAAGGSRNVAVGAEALTLNTGDSNTAVGRGALKNNTNNYNTAVGYNAGYSWTTGYDNIAVGTGAYGAPAESRTIRIGGGNLQTRTFIEGIRGASYPMGSYFDETVCTNSLNQLGPCGGPSSARFKDDIQEMSVVSEALDSLRPVTFHYTKRTLEADGPPHYGLIAEEVAKVFPHVVRYDGEGKPYAIRYELLTPILLKELQDEKQRREEEVEDLRLQVAELRKIVGDLKRRDEIQRE